MQRESGQSAGHVESAGHPRSQPNTYSLSHAPAIPYSHPSFADSDSDSGANSRADTRANRNQPLYLWHSWF
jgi:hypothetical protein